MARLNIWEGAFSEMYTTGHPCVGSYTMKKRGARVVFTAVPIEPVEVDGETHLHRCQLRQRDAGKR